MLHTLCLESPKETGAYLKEAYLQVQFDWMLQPPLICWRLRCTTTWIQQNKIEVNEIGILPSWVVASFFYVVSDKTIQTRSSFCIPITVDKKEMIS